MPMWLSDQYKAAFQWRGDDPDPEPHYGLVFLLLLPVAAGIGSVAWLGWTWPALVLTVLVTIVVAAFMMRLWVRNTRIQRAREPEWR